jgi:hypothetical protein
LADSGAVRQARYKRHRQGDCSLCHHDRPHLVPVAAPDPGDDFDPATEMRRLAGRLSAAYQADPGNAALARELRATLLALQGPGGQADPELAALFAEFGRG